MNAELREKLTDVIDFGELTDKQLTNVLDFVEAGCFDVTKTDEELQV